MAGEAMLSLNKPALSDWLEDLRTPEENAATANFMLAELRCWVESPDTRLYYPLLLRQGRRDCPPHREACAKETMTAGHARQFSDRAPWDRDPIPLSRLTSATPRQEFLEPPLERGSAPTR